MSSRVIAVGPQNYGDSSGRGKKCARKQKYRGDAEHNSQPDRHATNYLGSEGASGDWKISGGEKKERVNFLLQRPIFDTKFTIL